MSLSLFVLGIVPPDEKFKKMKQIYDLCIETNIYPPREVEEFFDDQTPNEMGIEVSLVADVCNDCEIIIDVQKIPKNVRFIKAYMN